MVWKATRPLLRRRYALWRKECRVCPTFTRGVLGMRSVCSGPRVEAAWSWSPLATILSATYPVARLGGRRGRMAVTGRCSLRQLSRRYTRTPLSAPRSNMARRLSSLICAGHNFQQGAGEQATLCWRNESTTSMCMNCRRFTIRCLSIYLSAGFLSQ